MAIVKAAVVGYKVPKKMKKRRQLDALVDNVKLPRNRKNSSNQELLDGNTDSSENDEFSMAGVDHRRTNRCCICHGIVVRIGLFMVTMACLSTCLGLVWVQWHLRHELIMLRETVQKVQSTSTAETDMAIMQKQMKDIDTTLTELKKEDEVLKNLKGVVEDLSVRLKKVEALGDKLNHSVNAAQTLLNVPERLKGLTDVVASQGSDQQTQAAKTEQLEQRIADLEGQLSKSKEESRERKGSLDAQLGDMLLQQVASINETTSSNVLSVKADLENLKGRLSTLEAFTQTKEPGLNHDQVESLVLALIQEKVNNLTMEAAQGETGEGEPKDFTLKLSQLSQNVSELKNQMAERLEFVSKTDFQMFKESTVTNFEKINETLFTMDAEFVILSQKQELIDAAINNMSSMVPHTLEGISMDAHPQNDVHALDTDRSTASPSSPSPVQTGQETNNTAASGATGDENAASDTSEHPQLTPEEIVNNDQPDSQEVSESPTDVKHTLDIPGIETKEDLHKAFSSLWQLENGQLDTHVLLTLLRDNTATREQVEKFDTNGDGRFNEEELANLFGLEQ